MAGVNDKPSLVRTYDQSFVTVRPKDKEILGSSGAVWASEQIRSVKEYPTVYCIPSPLPTDMQHSYSRSSIVATFIPSVLSWTTTTSIYSL